MRLTAFLVLGALVAGPALAAPVANRPHVDDTSVVAPSGERILRESIVVKAPRAEVWKLFATSEGLRKWEAPVAAIDLRLGGMLEATYDPKGRLGDPGNIKHQILSYVPESLLVFHNVQTPPGFQHADLFGHVTTVIQLEDAGPGETKVTVSGVGYGQGPDYDALYNFFHGGNAYLLETLKAAVEGGPGPSGSAHSDGGR